MIEKMFSVVTVAPLNRREEMIEKIRNMGVLHIADRHPADPAISLRFDSLSKTRLSLKEIPGSSVSGKVLSEEKFEELDASVLGAYSEIKNLSAERNRLSILVDQLKDWGRFEPDDIKSLASEGIELHFYRMGKKEYGMLGDLEDVRYVRLSPVGKTETVAVVGKKLDSDFPAVEFVMPEKGIGTLEEEIHSADVRIEQNNEILKRASQELSSYDAFILKYKNMAMMSSVTETSVSDDNLVWLCGYIPESDIGKFKAAAKSENWAYCISEPEAEDEKVPTKVKYNKVTGIIKPVFDILGTVPGYHEHDISFWFLCFFALFFAMIIGDAGYGLCFLAVAVVLNVKQKKLTNLTLLVYLMSLSTVAWGAVTGTWFGLEGAMNIPLLKSLVIKQIANYPEAFGYSPVLQQNNIMKFCFMIGTVQLTLACVINIRTKLVQRNLSWIADVGWLLSINALYYIVLLLVINQKVNLKICAVTVGVGFLLVSLFGGMSPDKTFAQGLKAGLADMFTNFLNTISAFGNVMSYIRLFAVGMASLAIAQSFNDMAFGLDGWMKIAAVVIFIIGHVLNLVMGLLSVVVHGVRLNLLEFSGQLGMEWSGIAYEPFKKCEK